MYFLIIIHGMPLRIQKDFGVSSVMFFILVMDEIFIMSLFEFFVLRLFCICNIVCIRVAHYHVQE